MVLNASAPQHPLVYTMALLLHVSGLAVDRAVGQCMDGLCGPHGDCIGSAAACADPDQSGNPGVEYTYVYSPDELHSDIWRRRSTVRTGHIIECMPNVWCRPVAMYDVGGYPGSGSIINTQVEGCCKCHAGWAGDRCQVSLTGSHTDSLPGVADTYTCETEREREDYCGAHGACLGTSWACPLQSAIGCNSFACQYCCECDDGWYGKLCELNDHRGTCDQAVEPMRCYHGGSCVGSATLCANGIETEGCCRCAEGFYGLHCEHSTNPCSPYAEHRANCGQHGTCDSACVVGSRDCAVCVCEAGWYAGSSTSTDGESPYVCIACGVGKYSTAGAGQTSENVCIACSVNTTSREGSTSASDCVCIAGTYSASGDGNTSGDACIACRAGMFSDTEGSTSCHACTAGQSAIAGSTLCSPCVVGFYNPSSGGLCKKCDQGMTSESGATTCAKVDCPDSSKPCTVFDGTRARGDSECPEGFDIDTTDRNATHAAVVDAVTCEPCPQPRRCAGVGGACSYFSTGPMCNSCLPNHYPAGFFCAKCAESKLVAGVFAAVAFIIATLVLWLLSKEKKYEPPTTTGAAKYVAKNLANPLVASGRRVAVAAGVQATTRSSGTVVTSICWPHFTFAMLPLQLPNVNWPELVKATATWFRSLVFLDLSVAAQPECFATGMDLVTKKLVRLGVSHAAFWLLVSVFFIFRCCGSRRAINASVITFMMGHTYLLRSCLGTLHCVARTGHKAGLDENLGHLQSDIGIACDVRMTTMLEALCCSFAMVAITQRLNYKEFEPLHCGWMLTVGWMLVTLCRVAFWPIAQLSYMLPTLGLVGSVLYGLIIPKCLHLAVAQQMSNVGDAYHHDNGFISQYGYLVTRFKPEKWGSEFRILGRKTMLLFATIIFAESTGLATVTQLVALVFALVMQCRETPFAETGSKAASFGDYPGWSRADKLEALSLVSQIGLVAVAPFASDERELVISILVLVFVALPAVYGTYVMLTEWKNGRRRKESTKCRLLVKLCLLGTLCVVVGGGVVAFQGRIEIEEGSMSRFDW